MSFFLKKIQVADDTWLICTKKYRSLITKDWFDESYWKDTDALQGQSLGRGTAYFFNHKKKSYILRHYRRGGLVGKLVKRSYFFTQLKKTRAYQELKLLKELRKYKLPVPKPVAVMVTVNGNSYQASIIMRTIKNADDLFTVLQKRSLTQDEWQQVGAMIRHFHNNGLYHSDLNIHNIMLNAKGKLWLIDFDKCYLMEPNSKKLEHNLERLLRSLRKEQEKQSEFHWQEQDWAQLLFGYGVIETD